jgi:hypothetical protein
MSNALHGNADLCGLASVSGSKKILNHDDIQSRNRTPSPQSTAKRGLLKFATKLASNRKRASIGHIGLDEAHSVSPKHQQSLGVGSSTATCAESPGDTGAALEESGDSLDVELSGDIDKFGVMVGDDETSIGDGVSTLPRVEPIGANLVISSPVLSRHSSSRVNAAVPLVCTPVAPSTSGDSASPSGSPFSVRRQTVQQGIAKMVAMEQTVSTSRPELSRSFSTGSGDALDGGAVGGSGHSQPDLLTADGDSINSASDDQGGDRVNVELRRQMRRRLKQRSSSLVESPAMAVLSCADPGTGMVDHQQCSASAATTASKTRGHMRSVARASSLSGASSGSTMVLRARADVCGATDSFVRSSSVIESSVLLENHDEIATVDADIVSDSVENAANGTDEMLAAEAAAVGGETSITGGASVADVEIATADSVTDVAVNGDCATSAVEAGGEVTTAEDRNAETITSDANDRSAASAEGAAAAQREYNISETADDDVWEMRPTAEATLLDGSQPATASSSEHVAQNRMVLRRGSGKPTVVFLAVLYHYVLRAFFRCC